MSALSDKARDFWDRISPRERMLVIVAAIAAPLTIAVWLGMSIGDGLDAMDKRNQKMRKALSALAELKANGPTQATSDAPKLTTEPLSLDTYLRSAATRSGVQIRGSITPRTPVTRNGFVTNSVAISLEDLEIDKLKAFLQDVETTSKVVAVTNLEVKRDRSNEQLLDAKLEVSTYSLEPKGDNEESGNAGSAKKGG